MTDKKEKDDGPACACGKTDLYEEMLKNQKKEEEAKKVEEESSDSNKTEKPE